MTNQRSREFDAKGDKQKVPKEVEQKKKGQYGDEGDNPTEVYTTTGRQGRKLGEPTGFQTQQRSSMMMAMPSRHPLSWRRQVRSK